MTIARLVFEVKADRYNPAGQKIYQLVEFAGRHAEETGSPRVDVSGAVVSRPFRGDVTVFELKGHEHEVREVYQWARTNFFTWANQKNVSQPILYGES